MFAILLFYRDVAAGAVIVQEAGGQVFDLYEFRFNIECLFVAR